MKKIKTILTNSLLKEINGGGYCKMPLHDEEFLMISNSETFTEPSSSKEDCDTYSHGYGSYIESEGDEPSSDSEETGAPAEQSSGAAN